MDSNEWVDTDRRTADDPDVVAERSEKFWRAYYRNDEQALSRMAGEFNLWGESGSSPS
jgi:hypothetical protein